MKLNQACKHGKRLRNCPKCLKTEPYERRDEPQNLIDGVIFGGLVENIHFFGFHKEEDELKTEMSFPKFPEEINHKGEVFVKAVSLAFPFEAMLTKSGDDSDKLLWLYRVPYKKG